MSTQDVQGTKPKQLGLTTGDVQGTKSEQLGLTTSKVQGTKSGQLWLTTSSVKDTDQKNVRTQTRENNNSGITPKFFEKVWEKNYPIPKKQ